MQIRRIRLRTLMAAVAVVGISLAAFVSLGQRRASGTILHVYNNQMTPIRSLEVVHRRGVAKFKPIMPGRVVVWRLDVLAPELITVRDSRGDVVRYGATAEGGELHIAFSPGTVSAWVSPGPGKRVRNRFPDPSYVGPAAGTWIPNQAAR